MDADGVSFDLFVGVLGFLTICWFFLGGAVAGVGGEWTQIT